MAREIPAQLRRPEFRFIRVSHPGGMNLFSGKGAIDTDWETKNNFVWDDPKITKHNGNIGIVCGFGGLVVVDCDKIRMEEFGLQLPKTMNVRTSKTDKNGDAKDPSDPTWRGRHLYFIVRDLPESFSQAKVKENGERDLGEVQGHKHYVVAPPSRHSKGEYYEADDTPIAEITFNQLQYIWPSGWFGSSIALTKTTVKKGVKLTDGRKTELFRFGRQLRTTHEWTEDKIAAALLIHNQDVCDPPHEEALVRKLAHNVVTYDDNQAARLMGKIENVPDVKKPRDIPRFVFWPEIEDRGAPGWLVKDLIPDFGYVIWAGPPNVGKSMLVQKMIHDLLNNVPIWGRFEIGKPVRNVLLIDNENDDRVLKTRFRRMGKFPEDRLAALHFEDDLDLFLDYDHINKFIEKANIDVVLLDTLRGAHDKDENDSKEMRALYKIIKPLSKKCLFIVVAHTRKALNGQGLNSIDDIRGSGDVIGTPVTGFIVTGVGEDGDVRHVKCVKQRQAAKAAPFMLRVDGKENEPLKITFIGETPKGDENKITKAKGVIHERCELDGEATQWTKEELKTVCMGAGLKKDAAYRAINQLIASKYFTVVQIKGQNWLRPGEKFGGKNGQ